MAPGALDHQGFCLPNQNQDSPSKPSWPRSAYMDSSPNDDASFAARLLVAHFTGPDRSKYAANSGVDFSQALQALRAWHESDYPRQANSARSACLSSIYALRALAGQRKWKVRLGAYILRSRALRAIDQHGSALIVEISRTTIPCTARKRCSPVRPRAYCLSP